VDVSDKHSRWLSFMERRLRIARELLTNDGIIMISIDDHEYAHLKLLCDEVFSEQNYICTFTWEMKRGARGVPPRNLLVRNHEYILCYGKSGGAFSFRGDDRSEGDYNKDEDGRLWNNESMKATGKQNNYFDIIDPSTGVAYHGNWAFSSSTIQDMIMKGLVIFPTKKGGTPRQKKYIDTYTNTTKAIVTSLGWFSTENATKELMDIFDGKKVFDFPKPLELMKYILKQATKKDSIVLDFFAGSGTTGQAVQELNREDGGSRQFILITNNQNNIACDVTYTRLQRTITRDTNLIYKVISNDIILSQE
jgi:adenine-specific DNA-methyltransferase